MKRFFSQSALTVTTAIIVLLPYVALAQEFVPLVGIPGVDENAQNTNQYINALYTLSIGLAAALAVVKIIMAGVQYMFSEIVTNKEQAKKDIGGALLGLLIILGAVTILNEINPNLRSFDIFQNAEKIRVTVESGPSVSYYRLLDEAIAAAEACGGEYNITGSGPIEVRCPTTNTPVSNILWKKTGVSIDQLHEVVDKCRAAGGRPSSLLAARDIYHVTCSK